MQDSEILAVLIEIRDLLARRIEAAPKVIAPKVLPPPTNGSQATAGQRRAMYAINRTRGASHAEAKQAADDPRLSFDEARQFITKFGRKRNDSGFQPDPIPADEYENVDF